MGFGSENILAVDASFRYVNSFAGRLCNIPSNAFKIYKSTLGQAAYNSIKENAVEALAYYAGGDLGCRVSKTVGSAIDQELNNKNISTNSIAYFTLSLLMSSFIIYSLFSSSGNNLKLYALKIPLFISFALFFNITFTLLSQFSSTAKINNIENLFEESFSLVGYISMGLIAAYKAIKTCGSEEEFYNSNNIIDTYPVKSLFSMGACAIMESSGLVPTSFALGQIVNLTYGSFFYNIKDIQKIGKATLNGTIFDKKIPAELKIFDELWLDKKIIDKILLKITSIIVNERLSKSLLAKDQEIGKSFLKGTVFDELEVDKKIIHDIKKIITDKTLSKITSIIENKKLSESLLAKDQVKKCLDETVSVFLNTLIHTINSYVEEFNSQNKSLLESRSLYLEKFEKLSLHMNDDLKKFPIIKDYIESHFNSLLICKNSFDMILFPLLDNDTINQVSEIVVEIVEKQEKDFVGINILNTKAKAYLKKDIQFHLKNISRLIPLFFLKGKISPPNENQIKTFYKNINILSQSYTKQVVGEKISLIFKDFISYQIQNSSL